MAIVEASRLRELFHQAAFVVDLGIEPVSGETGLVIARLRVQPRHRQMTGVAHAGVITTLADHTSGAAAYTVAPEGKHVVTAEIKISLLRGASGDVLRAVARVLKPGRQLVFTECEVFDETPDGDRLVAKSSATMVFV